MNKFFYPGTEKIDKPGLERHHQLIESSTLNTAIQSQKKVRESLPNNWIYNDNKANEVWSELEQFDDQKHFEFKPEGENPFAKINESTAKLRKTITNFEMQDQEFLTDLMELMSNDSFVDSLDQSSILFEARYRLQQMIEEHIDFGERQANLLGNLTTWFADVKNKEQDEQSSISTFKTQSTEEKINQLKKLIEDYQEMSAGQIEKAENLHADIIQNLNEKVNNCKKVISQKDLELLQMNQSLQQANTRQKGRIFKVRDSVQYDAELAFSQRKVMELQEQLNTLRISLSEYTKLKNSNSMKEIMLNANLTDQNVDILQNSSLQSERNSVLFSTFNTSEMNFTKLKEKPDGLISVEREIEFESKLCVLANQIKNLKDDNKILSNQIMQNRQSEIVSEKRFQSVERQKKTMESALQSMNKRMENMKESYERKIKDLQSDNSASSLDRESENFLNIKKSYEARMDKMSEDYRKQIKMMQDSMDKKYQKQINDVFRSCKNGDTSAALEQVTANFEQQALDLERHFMSELKDEKRKNAEKLVSLTKHYESIIKRKDQEIERIRNSVDSEVKSQVLDVQIELDDKFNAKSFEDHENSVNEYNDIRRKMQRSIDNLKEKLLKMTRERDTLKSLIEANDLAVELMDELEGNNENQTEEEEANENQPREDDVLQQSMLSLKEKEIEQKVSEKYALITQKQKQTLEDFHKYELENAQKFYKLKFQQFLGDFREKVVAMANETSDKMLNEPESIDYQKEVENLLVETVKLTVFDSDCQLEELFKTPTIPLSELDNKINVYRSQIASLASENEFWKATFKHLNSKQKVEGKSDQNNEENENVFDSMKAVIEKQSRKMAEIEKENRSLIEKLRQGSDSKVNLLEHFLPSIEIDNLVDFQLFDDSNDYSGFDRKEQMYVQNPVSVTKNPSSSNLNESSLSSSEQQKKSSIEDGQICCFHCHSCFFPQEVSKQLIRTQISKCPQCSHLALVPQSEEITIVDEPISESPAIKTDSNQISGDISLPTKPNIDSLQQQPVATVTENKNEQSSLQRNIFDTESVQMKQLKLQHKQEIEKLQQQLKQAQEKLKFDSQFQQQQSEQTKVDLEKALQRNEQLKSKLTLYEKNFGDLEKQYIKKINKMKDELSKLKKGFIEDSLFIVQSTQQLSDDQKENLEKKVSVSRNIAEMLSEVEFPSKSSNTKSMCQQFIDFSNEKFNENAENEPSFEDANEALSQAETVLYSLLTGTFSSSPEHSTNSNKTANDEGNSIDENENENGEIAGSIEIDSIFMCKLNVMKMNVDIVKEHNDFVAEIVNEVLNQFKEMSMKIKQIGKASIGMSKNMKNELNRVTKDLNTIIEQRTKSMNDAKRELLETKTAYDTLQEKFRTSVAAFEHLQINSETSKDEVAILKKKEDDQAHMIEGLTNKLLASQESNRKLEREIEELKLKIIQLESDQLLISARLDTQRNNDVEGNDESYQSSQTEEENSNENEQEIVAPPNTPSSVNIPQPLPSISDVQKPPETSLDFVPSFVIFSTEEQIETSRKKGFSLLPRRLALQQSSPFSYDVSRVSPQSSSAASTATSSLKNITSLPPEIASQKHEKIRIKYTQNNFPSTSASNARVIVPRSKPKTPMSRTASSTSSASQIRVSTPASEDAKSESREGLTRVLSFENLMPLSEDDPTRSLIGYITRYVPYNPEKSIENQAKIREEKKKILRTSSVLISEVPPDKLRYDSPPPPPPPFTNQNATKPMLNFGSKTPLNNNNNNNVNSNCGVSANGSGVSGSGGGGAAEAPRFARTKEDWLEKCERKIRLLEGQLREKSGALQDERDKSHRAIQAAFKANVELKQSQRQQKKATLLHEATKNRLQQALEMVSKSDNEIQRLKKLLNEVSHIARSIEEKETNERENVASYDDEKYRAFPTKKRVLARMNKLSFATNFEDESKRLLSVFRGVFSGLTSMAEKEIESIRKWAPKKDQYIHNEQKKLMSALEAMRFITSPDAYEESKTLKGSIHVNSYVKKQKKMKKKVEMKKRPASRPVGEMDEEKTSFEKAVVTANMHNQKIGKNLKKGVVGRPATSHSNVV